MSHFCVFVVTPFRPDDHDLAGFLQPWHEYECTGIDDGYVVDADETDKFRKALDATTEVVQIGRQTFWKYDERFWKDKVFICPDDGIVLEVTNREMLATTGRSIDQFAEDYGGWTLRDGKAWRRTNPNAKWDWWVLGGRFSDILAPAPDQVQRDKLPVDAIRARCTDEAARRYDEFERIRAGREVPRFEDVRKQHADIKAARKAYYEFPVIQALRHSKEFAWEHTDCLVPRDVYLARARASALAPFAIVKDGQWFERGSMGWWGIVTDEKDEDEWNVRCEELILNLEGSYWITIVDCHI